MAKDIFVNYSAEPTIRRFHRSDAFVRGIRGPVGSGKSTGCGVEILRRAQMQKVLGDGKRRSRWAVIRNCYDDMTEILTEERGWQLFKNLFPTDKVAALENGKLAYKLPNRVVRFPYSGEMVGFESEGVNFLVTPDHLMYVSQRRTRNKVWGEFEGVLAKDIYGKQTVRVKRDIVWAGIPTPYSEDFFEVLGYWFAEGSYGVYKNRPRVIITSVKDIEYARDLFKRAGVEYAEHKRSDGGINFSIKLKPPIGDAIKKFVKNAGKARFKCVPIEIKKSPPKHLRSFIDGVIKGDGSYNGSTTVRLSSKRLIDDLQEMAFKAGLVSNTGLSQDDTGREIVFNGKVTGKTNGPQYYITFVTPKKYSPILHVNPKSTNRYRGWYKQDYSGEVFCVEMEKVPVCVRRRGVNFLCYRTYRELEDTTLKTWVDWFGGIGNLNLRTMSFDIAVNDIEAEVLFRALDKPKDVKKLLSLELTGAWINEAREVPYGIVEALIDRVGRYPAMRDGGPTWEGVIMDTNSPDDDHWWYRLSDEGNIPEGWEFYTQPGGLIEESDGVFVANKNAENLNNLPVDYYVKRKAGKSKQHCRIYYCNQYGFITEGMAVIPEYNDTIHMVQEIMGPVKGGPKKIGVGLDFGLTPAAVMGQKLPFGRYIWFDELTTDGDKLMGAKQFAMLLRNKIQSEYPGYTVEYWGDPAGEQHAQTDEQTVFNILRAEGIPAVPARTPGKNQNDFTLRREAIANPLSRLSDGKPSLLIGPKCKMARKGLAGGYCYKQVQTSGEARYHKEPDKNRYSHVVDAGGYLMVGFGEGRASISDHPIWQDDRPFNVTVEAIPAY